MGGGVGAGRCEDSGKETGGWKGLMLSKYAAGLRLALGLVHDGLMS